jgi:TPP-dependent pyruvate/acetoin dehydrogenase alpha subunit
MDVAAALAGSNGFVLISDEKLLQLYATMLQCRMIAERARVLLEQNSLLSDSDAAVGQEAVAVGAALDLLAKDTVAFSQNDAVVNFIKGTPLEMIFRTLLERAGQPKLDAQLSLAVGAALNNKKKKNGRIAVAFCGDDSASRVFLHDAMCVAGDQQLPVLFVCQNSFLARPPHHKLHTSIEEITLQAEACGFPAIAVDGNDVVAVYRVATESLIECKISRAKTHDPIRKMERYLKRKGLFSTERMLEVTAGFSKQLDAAIEAARTSTLPQ